MGLKEEIKGFFMSAFVAISDVPTALDVAKPSVVSRILTNVETHGHVVAALL